MVGEDQVLLMINLNCNGNLMPSDAKLHENCN